MANVKVLHSFDFTDGSLPQGSLIADASGTLYGTTSSGGANGDGTVFELFQDEESPVGYTLATLVSFDGTHGNLPLGSLIADASGNLYGTTKSGGADGGGTVFEITRDATVPFGYRTTPSTLVSFGDPNGRLPAGSLIADSSGNLYGTTQNGGANGEGTVSEIKRDPTSPTGYSATPTTLASFDDTHGRTPVGSVIADASGNLFGTTEQGGSLQEYGTIFEITRDPTNPTGYNPTPTTLVTFNGTNGSFPTGSLITDASGDLYGTTSTGGSNSGGTVFELVHSSATGGYTMTTIASFNGANNGGIEPAGSLIVDAAGNLYGTTRGGGANSDGTVFEIARDPTSATGYNATPVTLASFDGANGYDPRGDLIADASGNLYGTTSGDGANNDGTVFEVTNTGFVTCFATGTLIRTARGDVAVEDLAVGDLAVTAAGAQRPIVWIGCRHLYAAGRALAHDQQPVRVRTGAFGPGLPKRDLFLSPGHPVLVCADADNERGVLVPIMCLINGTSIAREPRASVTYWHVELDVHDILLAEGLPVESYIDLGSRAWFEGADGALYDPDMALPGMPGRCRPAALDGPLVEAERHRLDMVFGTRLAAVCAWPSTTSAIEYF